MESGYIYINDKLGWDPPYELLLQVEIQRLLWADGLKVGPNVSYALSTLIP